MANKSKSEEEIYYAALKEPPVDRSAYIKATCGDDLELLERVESLLKIRETGDNFLESPLFIGQPFPNESPKEQPGTIIGRYKLLEKIGEGGMAVVYMAEQTELIRRKVALKIIKLGMDTKSVIARFEAERQVLAMMDHPNIAKVFDAGITDAGRPYFVMELVEGIAITEYCDMNKLSTQERLELFIQVCNAVQHAHQKGIIHRDIKPSNVMVTIHDRWPQAVVIDFGIAKATSQKLTEQTLFTRYSQIIGTPEYMSPEQAQMSRLDIDTRTDIYSLGVLLYELLTGTTPFSKEELRKAGYIEMQRIIREQDPIRPSTKLSTLGEALTDIAKYRGSTPDLLRKVVRGDLDWIVMKSLEKDRTRRYEAANMLAEDIRRHLIHEPVMARGPSTMYHLQKFFRRHRSQAIIALTVLAVALGLVVILSMWNQDRLQLAETESIRHRGILSHAHEQYARAERQPALETIKPILNSKFVGPEAQLLKAGILIDNRRPDEAASILSGLLNERPEIAGAAHSLLARIIWESESLNAEKLRQFEEHRRKAEALLPETAEAYFLRAMTAVTIKDQFVSLNKALQLDPDHYESRRLRAFTYYASRKYDRLKDDAMVMTVIRPRDPLGYSLHAVAWRELGRYREAIADYDIAIALTANKKSSQYIELSIQRCETLVRMGDYKRAILDAQACLKLLPGKPVFRYYIFCAMTALGDYEKANAMFREIVSRAPMARKEFREWCTKYVFDTLEAKRTWHPQDSEPKGSAFLPMVEAEETYRSLATRARRLTTNGFGGSWSPDGKKLAFSVGVYGFSGVAVFDPATRETDLLIVPGKDPRWSPDGKYIAFVRDCQLLRLEELATAENNSQQRPIINEEVWFMKSDGTKPRLLAQGSWPSWGRDSEHIYYQSRVENVLFSIPIVDQNAKPKQIMKCSAALDSVSPDNQRVSYFEAGKLKIKDLASQKTIVERPVPCMSWGVTNWSPAGNEVCLGGSNPENEKTGLWIYGFDKPQAAEVLNGQIDVAAWSADGTELAFCLGPPYFEIWAADFDPNIPPREMFGSSQTPDEHIRDMIAFYTRRIGADSEDAYAYSSRARYYDYLNDRDKANADMRCWSAVLSGSDLPAGSPQNIRRSINGLFGYQFVFSAERLVNEMSVFNVALWQKGRLKMKLFQIPILSTHSLAMSLLGLCLLSGLETPSAKADFIFGESMNLGPPVNTSNHDGTPKISPDGLELYFGSERPGGSGGQDIWVTKRASKQDPWGEPVNLGPQINTSDWDLVGSISSDGLSLYFETNGVLYTSTRVSRDAPWEPRVNLGPPVNGSGNNGTVVISPDGLELYFLSDRAGGYGGADIWMSTRTTVSDSWGQPVNLGPTVNSPADDFAGAFSPDGLTLLFCSNRAGGFGSYDTWMTTRASKDASWDPPRNLGPSFNTAYAEFIHGISSDGRWAYFDDYASPHPGGLGGNEVWEVPILPIVDFDGDGKVDGKEVLYMASQWGTNDPLSDLSPFPFGDGTVDLQDLVVLAEHIGKEVTDPTLVAHWALDEAEGQTALNSVDENENGYVIGDGVWQPDGGQVGGALQFDGINAYIVTSNVLNPANGPFSVLAWVKDGAPGQVVVSQQGTADLLAVDAEGNLITGLKGPGRPAGPLTSEAVITDGQWHRIGLSWDGSHTMLYVDGVKVVEDTQANLEGSINGLNIGSGKDTAPGTYWSGLIDDVRIYNRIVSP